MSGGSWDYVSEKFLDVGNRLESSAPHVSCYLLRRALGKQVQLIASALHAIEWVDSCDWSDGDERAALEKCFKEPGQQVEARELLVEIERLKVEVERVCAGMTQGK